MARRVSVLDDSWLVHDVWLAKQSDQPFCEDALAHLRWIQHALSMPLPGRQTSERLSTTVTSNDSAPLRTGPHRPPRNDYCVPHCCVAKATPPLTSFFIGLRQVGGQDSGEDDAVKGAGTTDAGHAGRDARDLPYV